MVKIVWCNDLGGLLAHDRCGTCTSLVLHVLVVGGLWKPSTPGIPGTYVENPYPPAFYRQERPIQTKIKIGHRRERERERERESSVSLTKCRGFCMQYEIKELINLNLAFSV